MSPPAGASATASPTEGASPGAPAPQGNASSAPTLSSAVPKIVGPKTADLLARAKRVATFRLDPKDFVAGDASPDRFFGYKILGRGEPLDERATSRLVKLLLADESYGPDEKYKCSNDFSVGLRVEGAGGPVELNFVHPCNRISFFRRADGDAKLTPGEYIDPVGDEVNTILRNAFSDDKAPVVPR